MGGFNRAGFNRAGFNRSAASDAIPPPVVVVPSTRTPRRLTTGALTHLPHEPGTRSLARVTLSASQTVPLGTTSAAAVEVEMLELDDWIDVPVTAGATASPITFEWEVGLISTSVAALGEDAFSTFEAFEFATSTGALVSEPTLEDVLDLNLLKLKSITIRRSATDKMWGFSTEVSGATDPDISVYPMVVITAQDHNGVPHVLFSGLTPDIQRTYQPIRSSTGIGGNCYAYYLSRQYVPRTMLTISPTTPPHSSIEALIAGTRLQPHRIAPVDGWGDTVEARQFTVEPKTPKQALIDAICDATKSVFYTKPAQTGSFPPAAYYVREDLIDDPVVGLDLPPMAVITNPDPHLMGRIKHASDGVSSYDRVTIRGSDENGNWYEAIVETPEASAGAPAREYLDVSTEWDSQAKCQERALALFNYYASKPIVYEASFKDRVDLELFQMMQFKGYTEIPDDVLRIIDIEYKLEPTANRRTVKVLLAKVAAMKTYAKLIRAIKTDSNTVIETVTRAVLEQQPSFKLGTITAIDGNFATVALDMGGTIIARIP